MRFHPGEHEPTAKQKRYYIGIVLSQAHEPLNATQIAEEIKRKFHAYLSPESIGSNLGFMRVAGEVNFVKCLLGMHRYAHNVYPVVIRHWYSVETMMRKTAQVWAYQKRLENEQKYLSHLPLTHPKRRRKPRTDDMRQMIEDLTP